MAPTMRTLPDPRRLAAPLLALATLGLGGCAEDAGEALLRDYQQELAERLERPPPEPAAPDNIGAFPELRERRVAIPEVREGLLDVYALRECHITTLVAERNSTLGRVAPASERWRYELTLLERLESCLDGEVAERLAEADLARLKRLAATKREQLPAATWNGLFASEEWADSFSRVSSPLPADALAPPPAQREALAYLRRLSLAPFDPQLSHPDPEALEGHLQALRERPYTAELLRTLVLAERRLAEATALLETRLAEEASCPTGGFRAPLEQAAAGPALADWLVRLESAAETWLTDLGPLFTTLETPPPAVAAYQREWLSREHAEAPLPAFRRALATHRERRRALAERCRTTAAPSARRSGA
ncbi:Protein of unknown function [Halomonas shengliensis]|uniref:DUF3080 domain-containing protein n=1 Tax=Halomonas shengliensis TaxID=419597 RepID=A0A1H0NBE8_9GAMM|nr:DUF3080 family protein [Halomonas shengliensis]SDO89981.1 Protein of unknown function [Halomonas shengliensis]